MNDLDRQLAELALINQAELQPGSSSTPGKKVGPAVPPKPKKSQPQIPQSYPLKQTVEPSYSSRLQANQFYSNVPPPNPQSHYSNTPTLPVSSKFRPQHVQDNTYVNVARESDHAHQYSNLPRSGSAMSSASAPRQASTMANYGSSLPQTCSLPRQGMGSPATGPNHPVSSLGPKGYSKPDHVTYSNIQIGQSRNQDGIIYSNLIHPPRDTGNVYSNTSAYGSADDLPPPPPPLDMSSGLADYAPCTVNTNLPPPPEDLLPPPSPVSSSYSELRRATQPGQDFHNYSMESQFEDNESLYGCGSMSQYFTYSNFVYEPTEDPIFEPIDFTSLRRKLNPPSTDTPYYSSMNYAAMYEPVDTRTADRLPMKVSSKISSNCDKVKEPRECASTSRASNFDTWHMPRSANYDYVYWPEKGIYRTKQVSKLDPRHRPQLSLPVNSIPVSERLKFQTGRKPRLSRIRLLEYSSLQPIRSVPTNQGSRHIRSKSEPLIDIVHESAEFVPADQASKFINRGPLPLPDPEYTYEQDKGSRLDSGHKPRVSVSTIYDAVYESAGFVPADEASKFVNRGPLPLPDSEYTYEGDKSSILDTQHKPRVSRSSIFDAVYESDQASKFVSRGPLPLPDSEYTYEQDIKLKLDTGHKPHASRSAMYDAVYESAGFVPADEASKFVNWGPLPLPDSEYTYEGDKSSILDTQHKPRVSRSSIFDAVYESDQASKFVSRGPLPLPDSEYTYEQDIKSKLDTGHKPHASGSAMYDAVYESAGFVPADEASKFVNRGPLPLPDSEYTYEGDKSSILDTQHKPRVNRSAMYDAVYESAGFVPADEVSKFVNRGPLPLPHSEYTCEGDKRSRLDTGRKPYTSGLSDSSRTLPMRFLPTNQTSKSVCQHMRSKSESLVDTVYESTGFVAPNKTSKFHSRHMPSKSELTNYNYAYEGNNQRIRSKSESLIGTVYESATFVPANRVSKFVNRGPLPLPDFEHTHKQDKELKFDTEHESCETRLLEGSRPLPIGFVPTNQPSKFNNGHKRSKSESLVDTVYESTRFVPPNKASTFDSRHMLSKSEVSDYNYAYERGNWHIRSKSEPLLDTVCELAAFVPANQAPKFLNRPLPPLPDFEYTHEQDKRSKFDTGHEPHKCGSSIYDAVYESIQYTSADQAAAKFVNWKQLALSDYIHPYDADKESKSGTGRKPRESGSPIYNAVYESAEFVPADASKIVNREPLPLPDSKYTYERDRKSSGISSAVYDAVYESAGFVPAKQPSKFDNWERLPSPIYNAVYESTEFVPGDQASKFVNREPLLLSCSQYTYVRKKESRLDTEDKPHISISAIYDTEYESIGHVPADQASKCDNQKSLLSADYNIVYEPIGYIPTNQALKFDNRHIWGLSDYNYPYEPVKVISASQASISDSRHIPCSSDYDDMSELIKVVPTSIAPISDNRRVPLSSHYENVQILPANQTSGLDSKHVKCKSYYDDVCNPVEVVSTSQALISDTQRTSCSSHYENVEISPANQTSSLDTKHVPGSSSTYESIYEPINPRPPSQMSSRSNYSLYAPYVSGASSTMTGPSQSVSRIGHNKEQEVDSLTDLLVQGMGGVGPDTDQEDVYGVCVKCGEKIVGENSGCTAMDQLYHTTCFTCHHCAINLQGKPFYALDGNPYCEEDYLNTLEKCCVCQKPILDRILRATGKPYHPKCFCCVVCGKSLDGIPFTVDATNRVHCIEDFHKIFAPRCWVCKQPIMPEPGEEETVRVVALDHSFHIQCYKCEDCGLVLSSESEGRGCYPLDGHVLCKSCNAKRVQALTSHMTTEL